MALTPEQTAALARLNAYNGNGYNVTTNPYGFARGGNQLGVFIAALKDVALMGQLAGGLANTADQFAAAVAAIMAGPVTSVVGQSGAVTAAQIRAALGLDAPENLGYRYALQIHFGR